MRVFLDTNVIMDILIAGRPSSEASLKIVDRDITDDIRFSISALSIADIVYSCRKHFSREYMLSRVSAFQKKWRILELSHFNIYEALSANCPDFEDALQISMAESDCDVIVTNNIKDFKGYTALEVVTPREFLEKISIS
jgi:predicted nucleic acid-binding protein